MSMQPAPPVTAPSRSAMRTAWLVVFLLLPVGLLNYLDRQMLAAMKTSVMESIPTIQSNENWGYMLGQFKWVYAFLSPVGGLIADRFSRRYAICGSLFVWSAVTWWTGHVETYEQLLWARSLMGISEAFYIPAALALIADYHTGGTRSKAVGLHQMAIYCGVIVGGFSGYVADNPSLTWRFAFDLCGIAGMLYSVPLLLLLRDAPRAAIEPANEVEADRSADEPRPTGLASVGKAFTELFGNPSYILLLLYFTLPAMAGWVVRDWMPAILKERFQIGQGIAGVSATFYVQVASILGAIVGGVMADRWMRTNPRGRIYVSAFGMAFIVPAIFGIGFAPSLTAAILFLSVFGIGWGLFDGNNMPILCQIVRPELRATGYGYMNMVSISCGGLADWGFGRMYDRQVPLQLIFAVFAGLALCSAVLVLLIRPRPELVGH